MIRGSGLGRGRPRTCRCSPVSSCTACCEYCQQACPAGGHASTGRTSWLRMHMRGTKLLFAIVALLLVLSLTCFFRASVTILWVWDSSHTTWLVQHFESSAASTNLTLSAAAATIASNPLLLPSPPDPALAGDRLDAARIFQYASLDPYIEKVDEPIIARLLEAVITPGGAVDIPLPRTTKQEEELEAAAAMAAPPSKRPSLRFLRRPPLEAWELELSRPRYRPYWRRFQDLLRGWAAARRYDPQVMRELKLLAAMANTSSTASEADQQELLVPHKTCAVVGSSGILLRRDYGAFIDSHDMVIRINGARTQSYERHVGSKTTLAVANSNMLRVWARALPGRAVEAAPSCAYPYAGRVPFLVYICQPAHLMEVAVCRAVQPGTPLLVTDPRLDALCFRIAKWYSLREWCVRDEPAAAARGGSGACSLREWERKHGGILFHHSSGMQAVVLALGLCARVHLFGFGKEEGVKHHYHGVQKAELSIHDYAAEYALYRDLENNRSADVAFLNQTTQQGFLVPPLRVFL